MSQKLKTIDLFAGIGGVRIAFERQGFETVFANDFDKNCKTTYDLNFSKQKMVCEDITKITSNSLPKYDILLGGFPCQPFSIAGYRKGFQDSGRGDLFFKILDILRDTKPQAFLLENVKNLKSHDKGETLKYIVSQLHKLGYYVSYQVMNTMEYGNLPQNRERIYIVGFLSQSSFNAFTFPNKVELQTKLENIYEKHVEEKYYYSPASKIYPFLDKEITRQNTVYQWRRVYVRENKNGVSPTLTANMGTGGHNVPIIRDKKGIRKLTPRECARLQGFPDSYKFPKVADSHLYKQIGNSVSIPVLESIAKNIFYSLNQVAIHVPSKSTSRIKTKVL
jgi:DNA (cytosine-5)-methyltransferase 1